MKKIIGLIVLVALVVGGYYLYTKEFGIPTDPVQAYQKITGLPASAQASAFEKTVASWIQDPASLIPYPKGWRTVSVTIGKETFSVLTPDTANPPQYYVSTGFPKDLVTKVTIAKCLDLDPKSITEWCAIGNNAEVNDYFSIVEWVKNNSTFSASSLMSGISGKMNILPNAQ